MGAFDKDREMGMRADVFLGVNKPFVLLDVAYDGDTQETKYGDAEIVRLAVAPMVGDNPGRPAWVQTVAIAVVEKLRKLDDDELPAVCMLARVDTKTRTGVLVIQYLGPWSGGAITAPERS